MIEEIDAMDTRTENRGMRGIGTRLPRELEIDLEIDLEKETVKGARTGITVASGIAEGETAMGSGLGRKTTSQADVCGLIMQRAEIMQSVQWVNQSGIRMEPLYLLALKWLKVQIRRWRPSVTPSPCLLHNIHPSLPAVERLFVIGYPECVVSRHKHIVAFIVKQVNR
jgi:hypothetical protein